MLPAPADRLAPITAEWIAFGPFVLHLKHRGLTHNGKPTALNPRSLELLVALVERPGEVVAKEALIERIWPDRTVAEVNLRVAITALRRCLADHQNGETYILSMPGRGYAFSPNVRLIHWPQRETDFPAAETPGTAVPKGHLPLLLKPVIGRDGAIDRICRLLGHHRLVTIVGPGGIGKTTAAIVAASRPSHAADEVCFVDLAPTRDAGLVLAHIAAALAIDQAGDPLQAVINFLATRRMLLVLDNCEHVIDALAKSAAAILQGAAAVRMLATSREALHIDGEAVHRLEGLDCPPAGFEGGIQEAMGYAAVELLVERIQAADSRFVPADSMAASAVEICRRLDGIALAIQLAAGRVASFGLAEVASRLGDRFRFLTGGARSALPRHQTLDAAINWSFELLDEKEQIVCTRLAIFSGEFSLDAAAEIAGWAPVGQGEAADLVAGLIEKSLIVFVADPARPHYVFLETIRDFARARLAGFDPHGVLAARLAARLIADCHAFADRTSRDQTADATAFARRLVDDVRYTVARTLESGDAALHSALLVACAPPMLHLGSSFELSDWLERALGTLTSPRERLPLLMPYARAIALSRPNVTAMMSLYAEAVRIAESLDDWDAELRARWGLSYGNGNGYSAPQCLKSAEDFETRAKAMGDASAMFVAATLKARALHDIGDYARSMEVHRQVVERYPPAWSVADVSRFGLNHRAIAMCDLSEICWQIGKPAEAEEWNIAAIREAGEHLPTLFVPASQHLCRTIWEGNDWSRVGSQFEAAVRRFNVNGRWKSWLRNLGAIIDIQQHGAHAAFAELDADILAGRWHGLTDRFIWIAVHFIQCCMSLGKWDLAGSLANRLVSELQERGVQWMMPEALRLKALVLAETDAVEADACFDAARACADRLGAVSFAAYIAASASKFRRRCLDEG